jgi:hypothetical protein
MESDGFLEMQTGWGDWVRLGRFDVRIGRIVSFYSPQGVVRTMHDIEWIDEYGCTTRGPFLNEVEEKDFRGFLDEYRVVMSHRLPISESLKQSDYKGSYSVR